MNDVVSFTSRDIVSIRNDIINYIKEATTKISDFNESEVAMVLIEVLAGVADMLNYYIDTGVSESFLMTAKQPSNIRALLQGLNYKVPVFTTSRGSLSLSLKVDGNDESITGNISIPRFTTFSTDSGIKFVTINDTYLNSTTISNDVEIAQGNLVSLKVQSSVLKESFKYYLPDNLSIPIEYVYLTQSDGDWECVDDAFIEVDGGKKYSVHNDSKGRPYILFTFDWKKYLPIDDSELVEIRYLISDGSKGEVPPYSILRLVDSVYDDRGLDCTNRINVANSDRTYGFVSEVDYNLAKANARRFIRTMGRCVTLDDYKAFVDKEPYILKSKVLDWNTGSKFVKSPNKVGIWVVTRDGSIASNEYLTEVQRKLQENSMALVDVEVRNADYFNIPIRVDLLVNAQYPMRETIRSNVYRALSDYLVPDNFNFGGLLYLSKIQSVCYEVSDLITGVIIQGSEEPYSLSDIQFPNFSSITVNLVGDIYGQKTDN